MGSAMQVDQPGEDVAEIGPQDELVARPGAYPRLPVTQLRWVGPALNTLMSNHGEPI